MVGVKKKRKRRSKGNTEPTVKKTYVVAAMPYLSAGSGAPCKHASVVG